MAESTELFQQALIAHQAGDLSQAERDYRRVLELEPEHARALTNLGVLLARQGQNDEAIRLYTSAIAAAPTLPDAPYNLGNLYRRLGQLEGAAWAYQMCIRIAPQQARAYLNLGLVFGDQGEWHAAVQQFRNALERDSAIPEGHNLLWDALMQLGQPQEAEHAIREFVARSAKDPRGYLNLGLTLTALDRSEDALAELQTALRLRPDYAEAQNALGVALDTLGRSDEANAHFRRAVAIHPEFADAWSNLGVNLTEQGRGGEAAEALARALALRPDATIASNHLLARLASSTIPAGELWAEHEAWAKRYAAPLIPAAPLRYSNPGPRLRVGYHFGELRTRPVAAFLEVLFALHDRQAIHVTALPGSFATREPIDRLRRLADSWQPLVGLSDRVAVERIREAEIDVLVDVAGHTAGNRLLVLAQKPARVQLSLFRYPGPTGLSTLDYRISDGLADPETNETAGPEQVLRLPGPARLYVPPPHAPAPNTLPAGKGRTLTFGCLNNPGKLSGACLDAWAAVLKAVPQSRLILLAGRSVEAARLLRERFSRAGVVSDRLEFIYRMPENDYLEAYQPIDLALDPFPFNGRATTCDALWMGVPVLSLVGDDCWSCQGLSILSHLGLPEFLAQSIEKYVELAATWAEQREALADLRCGLRELMAASPLTDAAGYVQQLEALYRSVVVEV